MNTDSVIKKWEAYLLNLEWCKENTDWEFKDREIFIKDFLSDLKELKEEPKGLRWVNCSERLPTRYAEYFIKADYKATGIFADGKFWSLDTEIPATQWLEETPAPSEEAAQLTTDIVTIPEKMETKKGRHDWQKDFYEEMNKYYPRAEYIPEIKDSVEEFQKYVDQLGAKEQPKDAEHFLSEAYDKVATHQIKKASENWRDIDPDKFLSEIRG